MSDDRVSSPVRPSRFRRYSEYRDSGVEWLGEIPAHWEVMRLKRAMANVVTSTVSRLNEQRPDPDLYVALEHVESWTGRMKVVGEDATLPTEGQVLKRFRAGDILYGKLRPYLAKVIRPRSPGVCVGEFLVLRSRHRRVVADYMTRLLCSKPLIEAVNSGTWGTKMPRAEWPFLGRLPIVRPPTSEQRTIADFLDRETARIDALISKKKELIGLLREKRTALITRAVTRGLEPKGPMKDSGTEWMGKIPLHWQVERVKRVARMESGHTPDKKVDAYWTDGDIPWVSLNDTRQLKKQDYIHDTAYNTNQLGLDNSSARLLPPRAVIFSRDATIGLAAITERSMAVSQHFIAWICNETVLPEYLLRVFDAMQGELVRLTMGATLRTIGMPDVGTLTTPIPPVSEQERIVAFVRHETAAIDGLIAKARQAIARLEELRTALISAAVTGRIDVREVAA